MNDKYLTTLIEIVMDVNKQLSMNSIDTVPCRLIDRRLGELLELMDLENSSKGESK